ncbi:MAG: hypothetical protein GF364_10045 [Candidatus Lokiarchaeota archaeon]|nr:hypothetical protein [Candidatus Lokiarchaeota archaeon]
MTTFDQRGQHVNNQYNAGQDININKNMSPTEFANKLDLIIQQLAAYQQNADSKNIEKVIKAKAELEIAKNESLKQDPDRSKIQSLMTSAKAFVSTIADLAQIGEFLIAAIPLINSIFA